MKIMLEKTSKISPEQNRGMVCWIRKILTGETSFLERLTPDEWSRFIAFTRKHGIEPVLYHAIKDEPPSSLSEHNLDELRHIYFRSAHRNVLIYHELGKVLKALKAADVPVILLKGACLAEVVYDNIALREMGDVDILVKEEDILKTLMVITALGYSTGHGFQFKDWAITYQRHLPPLVGPKKLKIDVHWAVVDFGLQNFLEKEEIGNIWERARPAVISGTPVFILSPEDLLMHLCVHLSKGHLYNTRLRDFLDLKQVTVNYKTIIDWGLLQERSCQWAVDRAIRLSLFLADRLVGLALPECVQRDWRPKQIDPVLSAWIERKILDEIPGEMTKSFREFIVRNSVCEKMVIIWQSFFLPRSLLSQIYFEDAASWKIYLFYPVRWLSLFKRYGTLIWKVRRSEAGVNKQAHQDHALQQWLANK
jgi:hypothetical protein